SAAGSIRYVILRYFNAAGAHPDGTLGEDHNPESHLIPLTLQAALGVRNDIGVFGDDYPTPDGTCIRDYIHVTDLAKAHLLAVKRLAAGRPGGVFNLGNGVGFSVRQVIDQARAVTGRDIRTRILPRRTGDPDRLVASSAKAEAELEFKPRHSGLEEIIASAWEWHRKHPQGFRG
ncbi:MAG: NAD-dependent epimerase/dehydratase family protein, partial [Planctomycetota bacterium]|nr:NAD-dependent epimerase/dehydratase family protein [Planctomycetota bacterium]